MADWKEGLTPVRNVHHQIGNFQIEVTGDRAAVHCYGTSFHYREEEDGDSITTFVGTYDLGFRKRGSGWLMDQLRFNAKFVETRPAGG